MLGNSKYGFLHIILAEVQFFSMLITKWSTILRVTLVLDILWCLFTTKTLPKAAKKFVFPNIIKDKLYLYEFFFNHVENDVKDRVSMSDIFGKLIH